MDIIKDLPGVFEAFGEQRQQSFLIVKELKEQGVPLIGSYCTYFPRELPIAMDAVPVSLCSTSDETIVAAEADLPKNLCPLIKSSYGFAKTEKCPYFYFSDLVVGETTCDGKKKMFEYMSEFKDVFVMQLPSCQDGDALKAWEKEIHRLKTYMEKKFGRDITEINMRRAVHICNQANAALSELCALMKNDPAPMSGYDLFKVLYGSGYRFDREELAKDLRAMKKQIEEEYAAGKMFERRPRILVTGCPIGGATEKVIQAIENNGGVVVAYENCNGEKAIGRQVDESAANIYEALAYRYLNIGCSVMSPNPNREELLGTMIDEYHVDGVIEMTLQTCLTYDVESGAIRRFVRDKKGIPFLSVQTDYSQADIEQLNTRITAFLEML